jgi:hypothetical protein
MEDFLSFTCERPKTKNQKKREKKKGGKTVENGGKRWKTVENGGKRGNRSLP